MRVILMNRGQNIGYLDYEIMNWYEKLGYLGHVVAQPQQFAEFLRRKIETNAYSITVTGGSSPSDLTPYWDGVVMTLAALKQEVRGFDYMIPPEEDPLQDTDPIPEDLEGRVY